jgi:hypothetical protein
VYVRIWSTAGNPTGQTLLPTCRQPAAITRLHVASEMLERVPEMLARQPTLVFSKWTIVCAAKKRWVGAGQRLASVRTVRTAGRGKPPKTEGVETPHQLRRPNSSRVSVRHASPDSSPPGRLHTRREPERCARGDTGALGNRRPHLDQSQHWTRGLSRGSLRRGPRGPRSRLRPIICKHSKHMEFAVWRQTQLGALPHQVLHLPGHGCRVHVPAPVESASPRP